MTEQIFGSFEQEREYDTSVMNNGSKLYYFKRLFSSPDVDEEDLMSNLNESFMEPEDTSNYSKLTKNKSRVPLSKAMKDIRLLMQLERQVSTL